MQGEQAYNRAVYEVVQEIIRQLLLHDGADFDYKFQSENLGITSLEQLKILRLLSNKKIINFKQHVRQKGGDWSDDDIRAIYYDRFEIVTTKEKLDQYAASLNTSNTEVPRMSANTDKTIMCTLQMKDRDMVLKVGEYPEQKIGKMLEGRPLYRLMAALSGKPPGVFVTSADVLPNVDDLWQLFAKSNYSYLAPFFQHSKKRIAFFPTIELSIDQVLSILSKVTDKYRQNVAGIAKNL
ncbi:MAG TPA: hypothetical protein VMR18_00795 [Candidatus Saccharimonadales bacterium]|nr:hypothetical protein [Candidatus Saccharimonadales bacterium]